MTDWLLATAVFLAGFALGWVGRYMQFDWIYRHMTPRQLRGFASIVSGVAKRREATEAEAALGEKAQNEEDGDADDVSRHD